MICANIFCLQKRLVRLASCTNICCHKLLSTARF